MAAVIVAAAVAVGLSGCGGSSPSPSASATPTGSSSSPSDGATTTGDPNAAQLLKQAQAAASSASSVTVKGTVPSDGKVVTVDMSMGTDSGSGTIDVGGMTISIIRVGSDVYFSADDAFWTSTAGPAAAKLFSGKWVKIPATTQGFDSFAQLSKVKSFMSGLFGDSGSNANVEYVGTTDFQGQSAYQLSDPKGTLYIAAEGEPFPLGLTGAKDQALTFSDWNAPLDVQAPPSADVVDLGQLQG